MAATKRPSASLTPLLLFLSLTSLAAAAAPAVVVEGVVYCQSCDLAGTESLTGASPLPAAKVEVSCKDYRGRLSYYKVFSADPYGYFFAQLEDLRVNHYYLDHPLQSCHVRLFSSPHPTCTVATNVNGGVEGAALRYDEKKMLRGEGYEAVIYAAGPLAFRPENCPEKKATKY